VAPHAETSLWSQAAPQAEEIGVAHRWAPLQVIGEATDGRLPVLDPADGRRGWVNAADVGPVDPALAGGADVPPIGRPIAWSGPARVTMHTCTELGGCGPTASGLRPEPGMVAVDPAVIPLGSTVWIQGLGTFLAADTGSLVRGAHLDVFGWSYQEAMAWGIQERAVLVFAPS
jgi:3D (Asp-Asp-Asp) domain-containing protein